MCEVTVCKGDDGGHARTCSRVSRCEFNGVQSERRNTQVCVDCMETTTASDKRQRPSSGCSYNGDRVGLAQQRARDPDRAWHETAMCSFAGVKPGPETCAVNVADPATDKR